MIVIAPRTSAKRSAARSSRPRRWRTSAIVACRGRRSPPTPSARTRPRSAPRRTCRPRRARGSPRRSERVDPVSLPQERSRQSLEPAARGARPAAPRRADRNTNSGSQLRRRGTASWRSGADRADRASGRPSTATRDGSPREEMPSQRFRRSRPYHQTGRACAHQPTFHAARSA